MIRGDRGTETHTQTELQVLNDSDACYADQEDCLEDRRPPTILRPRPCTVRRRTPIEPARSWPAPIQTRTGFADWLGHRDSSPVLLGIVGLRGGKPTARL